MQNAKWSSFFYYLFSSKPILLRHSQFPDVLQLWRSRPFCIQRFHFLSWLYLGRQRAVRVHLHFFALALAFFLELDADESPVFIGSFFGLCPQVRLDLLHGRIALVSFYDHAAVGAHAKSVFGFVDFLLFKFLFFSFLMILLQIYVFYSFHFFKFFLLTAPTEGPSCRRSLDNNHWLVTIISDFGFRVSIADGLSDVLLFLRNLWGFGNDSIEPRTLLAKIAVGRNGTWMVARRGWFLIFFLGLKECIISAQWVHQCLLLNI